MSTPTPRATQASDITVRRAIPSDVNTFPEMKVRTWSETYSAFGVPKWDLDAPPQEPEFRAGFPGRVADPDRNTEIAYDEVTEKVVGYATAVNKPNLHGYIGIRAVYVLKEYQGMGIGRRLVEAVVGDDKDCRAIVGTLVVNMNARRFYEKMGFTRVVGEEPGSMGGVDLPGVCLARDAEGPETHMASIYCSNIGL